MTTEAMELARQAGTLPILERAGLVERILESLDASDPSLDALWAHEAQDRLEGWKTGSVPASDVRDVFPEL